MDLDLEALKTEILDYLSSSDFAVFRSYSGGLEPFPMIQWDTDRFPDYRMFLDTARHAGQKLVLFAARELEATEVDEALEDLDEAELTRDERRDYEKRLRAGRQHIGSICVLELAFDYNSHMYVYEARPDWYDDFIDATEEVEALIPAHEEIHGEGHEGIGGFYSNN